jgi:hypothetical protein
MGKILLVIFGILIFVVCILILFQILQAIFVFLFSIALFIIVVGGAFLILRKIFHG